MSEHLLEVKNLSVSFQSGRKTPEVLSGVSFYVDHGEILALVGESGCGKSASCLALTGLLPGNGSGKADLIRFDCKGELFDLRQLSKSGMRKIRGGHIAYIFQEPGASLNPVMRIGEQISEVLKLHRDDVEDYRRECIELLRQVGIAAPESRVNAYPHELSGGMQQRVMIAMALAGNPELLIADEPTTALDVTVQSQILALLERLRRERQMAVILISHNLGVVAQLADRIAVMYAGKIVESGRTQDILHDPCHPYTRALLAAIPVLNDGRSSLETIPGMVPAPGEFPPGCRFCGRCALEKRLDEPLRELCASVVPGETAVASGHICCCHAVNEKVASR